MQSILPRQPEEAEFTVREQRLYERLQGNRQFLIAEHAGETLPELSQFTPFEAYDFSRDGFAYWSPVAPTVERVIVALVYRKRAHFHAAKVMRVKHVDRDGQTWHQVGCKFDGRVEYADHNAAHVGTA